MSTSSTEEMRKWITKGQTFARQSILLEGPSGVGKTFQFRTLVDAGLKGLYVNVERKMLSVADLNADLWPLDNPDFPTRAADKDLERQDLMRLIEFLRTPDHGYDFVYLDSGMRYAEDLLRYLKTVKGIAGQELWGTFAEKLEMALKTLPTLTDPRNPAPVHVITTWGVEMNPDWQGQRSIQPLVDGQKVKPKINYWFDHVLYLDKLDDPLTGISEFVAFTQGKQGFSAKVSSGTAKLEPIIKNPNLAQIIATIEKGGSLVPLETVSNQRKFK